MIHKITEKMWRNPFLFPFDQTAQLPNARPKQIGTGHKRQI
jgi:hypothetical protein